MQELSSKASSLKISVDSLHIRIPVKDCKITDFNLRKNTITTITDLETGEFLEQITDSTKRQSKYSQNGIEVSAYISKPSNGVNTVKVDLEEYLWIKITSKLLCDKYLDGITINNIGFIYEQLKVIDFAEFSLVSLLSARCIDIDYKTDLTGIADFDEALKGLAFIAKDKTLLNRFSEDNNKGLEFGSRNGRTGNKASSTINKPYLKFYAKLLELLNRSTEFTSKHLADKTKNLLDTLRLEVTVKNAKHLKTFGIGNTLFDVLSASQEQKISILHSALNAHLDLGIEKTEIKDYSAFTTNEKTELQITKLLMPICQNKIENVLFYRTDLNNDLARIFKSKAQEDNWKSSQRVLWKKYLKTGINIENETAKFVALLMDKLGLKMEV